ncbi:MAG: amino acid adenylation domain-containing protein [Methylobacter sp.]
MTDTTTQVEQQQANRTQLIARLRKTDTPANGAISRRSDDQSIPLSYSQERLWIMSQLEPDNPIYNVAGAVQFDGVLNSQALQHSLDEVVRRHEILRSRFTADGQQALPSSGLPMASLDLTGFQPDKAMAQFQQCADDFICRPFLLAEQPPLRALLVVLGERRHILLLTLHHIVSDRWSVGVLMQEVSALYGAYSQGKPSALPELPIQYGDFCVWQRRRQEKWARHLDYWRKKLTAAPTLLELPADRPRPPVPSYRGDMHNFEVAPELNSALKELGKQYNVTLFMVMAAAFNTLLYRYTGSKDNCIGYPVAGRNQSQTTALIGFFVNTPVLRCQLEAGMPFSELLLQLREQALQDQNHQELSFGQLLDSLNPVRNTSHAPLFQVMLAVQNVPIPDFRMQDVSAMPLTMNNRTAQFDLSLFIDERDGRLLGSFEYSADLFDAETIARMAGHLQILLVGIVSKPQIPLNQLPLMSEAETRQLLDDWSGVGRAVDALAPNARPTADALLIHQLFEAQAQMTPDKTALAFAGQCIGYGDLNRRAELWAERLLDLGIGPECRVGVCAERSVELIVGLLAVLKAGAAYVPLDPGYPEERLEFMLNDAGIELLLIQSALAGKFQNRAVNMLYLDEDSAEGQAQRTSSRPISLSNTAYIIYTSGSTGQPKGVAVSHQNLLHSTLVRTNYYREPLGCFLLLSSFAFDSSVAGIFWTLSQGGCLCLPQQEDLTDPAALAGLINQHNVTYLLALPSFYTAIVDDGNLPKLKSLLAVIVAGEACSGDIAAEHRRKLPAVQFYNEYGPTEGTVWSTVYRSTKDDAGAMLPIGRAIANVRVYILDPQCQPVPIGVSGELCIGGAGLARGYLNRPALTAEKFIPNPFAANGERLYKTGDLARFRVDGEIEFLGRIDNQVKIRGYRIELGEIETRLQQHPGIEAAAVLAKEGNQGNKRLIAYIVGQPSSVPETQHLQSYLRQSLPDYMVPTVFVSLDKLPLTPNGKLDGKALPDPDDSEQDKRLGIAPRNDVEQTLAEIWSQLLGVQGLSIHDNFFNLGGDSILSIQAVSRAHQAGLTLTAKQLFQNQTIAELAAAITETGVGLDETGKKSAEQGRVTGEAPLTPIQQWFFDLDLINPHHWNQTLLLQSTMRLDSSILQQAILQLVEHHDALRLTFAAQEDGLKAVNQQESAPSFLCVDLDAIAPEQRLQHIETICAAQQCSLNLTEGPLLAVVLFDSREAGEQRLLWVVHHLVVDAVSWRILLEDLHTVYRQLSDGQDIKLPAKTTSFKQWATQLSEYAKSAAVQNQADYWLNRQQVARLPVDYPQGQNNEASTATSTVTLSETETEALLQQVPAVYRTRINDILLTALSLSLADWSGNNSVLIDLESHGREELFDDTDLSRTVGWFSSVYPVLFELPSDRTPGNLIKSIKEQLRHVPGNGIGYGLLRYLGDEKTGAELNQQPAAQIIFNYLGRLDSALPGNSPYRLAVEDSGAGIAANNRRAHEIDVIAKIQQGILQLSFKYNSVRFNGKTIEILGHAFLRNLQNLIRHCQLPGIGGYTPSDFPLAHISQQELDGLVLTPARIDDIYPLTPLQQGLVFHSLYAEESGVYCIFLGCRLDGAINVAAFKQAWQQTIDRHSILRTGFLVKNSDMPLQFVHRNGGPLPWFELDWQHLSKEQQRQHWQDFQTVEWQAGFDFAKPPLMRLTLIRCSDDRHYFAWSFHHLLQDGWSMSLILKDVFDCYQDLSAGRESRLPAAKPYRNYIEWMQRQDMTAAETYWRNTLAGFAAPTPLFIDKKADNTVSGSYGQQNLMLSRDSTARLHSYAQNNRLTLNTLIQGAWAILLSRYSGERDVMFGVTVSGRPTDLDGIEAMVGLFINTLPLRVRVPAAAEVTAWLQQLLEHNMTLRQYEYTPLVNINGWSEIPSGRALFDSLLVFENYPVDKVLREQLGSLSIADITIKDQSHYPLTVTAVPGTHLEISISYDQRYFDENSVLRMLGHFEVILESFAEQPESRLAELPLLTFAEKQQILRDWNATGVDYRQDQCIHRLFEAQVEKSPDAIAAVFGEQTLSYAELNAKANQLARCLHSKVAGPELLVGVCLERSLDMVIALLGILKAGGAYVPLDPTYPPERITYMLNDAGEPIFITQENLLPLLTETTVPYLCLDRDWPLIAAEPSSNLNIAVHPQQLAYVIYTSGSTGQPKGVMVSHHDVLRLFYATEQKFNLNEQDVWTMFHSYAFDFSVWEIWGALLYGGRLVVVPFWLSRSPVEFYDLLVKEQVTVLNQTPSAFQQLVRMEQEQLGEPGNLALRLVIFGGESLDLQSLKPWFDKHGDESPCLVNMYGITETTVHVTFRELSRKDSAESTGSPIGRPIDDLQVYVLDARQNLCPINVNGELNIGGAGLARGYLNRPDLTAERFIPNPYGEPGSRLYKSGDLACYRPCGDIDYLGRIDHQVKIRGFRIELGEIEARLHEHRDIKHAAVLAREDQPGDKRLVAYIVAAGPDIINTEQLRAYLAEKLPDYMVPSAFVYLETMPLSSNGKLDRKALPVPDRQAHRQIVYVAPRNDTEEILAAIWSDILAVEKVGVDDDFFELGGHSLTATQLVSRINKSFQLELALREVFEVSTVAGLALVVEDRLIEKLEALSEHEVEHLNQNNTLAV